MRIEYARVYDWGELTGLLNQETHDEYDRKTAQTRTLVIAILNELDYLLQGLRQTDLRYEDAFDKKKERKAADGPVAPSAPNTTSLQNTAPVHTTSPAFLATLDDRKLTSIGDDLPGRLFSRRTEDRPVRKFKRGLNHIMTWTKGVGTVASQPMRILWAVRDEAKFADEIDRVRELVDYLHHTLSEDQMQLLIETSQETKLGLISMTQTVGEMKALLVALKRAMPSSNPTTQSLSGETLVEEFPGEQAEQASETDEANFKRFLEQAINFRIHVFNNTEEGKAMEPIPFRDVVLGDAVDGPLRTAGLLNKTQTVWIEWKTYKPVIIELEAGRTEKGPDDTTNKRVNQLARLLSIQQRPAEFSVPTCLGYVQDKKHTRFGFVFEAPKSQSNAALPTSLFSLLTSRPVGLRKRVSIALQLSQCLILFHSVNWLHKGLRSANVLFFEEDPKQSVRPYISGFEYSRRSTGDVTSTGPPEDIEWAMYVHPEYLGSGRPHGFKQTYDMYSLGVILIEVACWQKIVDILRPVAQRKSVPAADGQASVGASQNDAGSRLTVPVSGSASQSSAEDAERTQNLILDPEGGVLDQVADAMGSRYRDAVEACIKGMPAFGLSDDQNQADPVISTILQQEFIRVVVDALKSIVV